METCFTLNNNWGYTEADKNWKSPELVIHSLVNCISKSRNLLLNVGPDALGIIPEESVAIISEVGKWMDKNSESIYCCSASALAKPDWDLYTQKGNTIYAHYIYPNLGFLYNTRYWQKDKTIYRLSSGAELKYDENWWGNNLEGIFYI